MGLYSFYKIIKDVVKTILGNKAWRYTLIVALLVIVFTIYSSKVNAEELQDHVVDYYTTYHFTQGSYNHQLVFVPVFANSSYSISWASGNSVTFSFIDNLTRENSAINVPMSTISTNDQGSFGYFATKDGYLVLDHYSTDFSHPTYNITTDYQFTANLQTIHDDLSTIIDYLYGNSTPGTGTITRVNLSLHSFTSDSTFYVPTNNDGIYYVPIEKNRMNHIKFHVDVPDLASSVVYLGYCDSIPASGVSAIYFRHFTGSTSYDLDYNFSGHDYVFVRAYGLRSSVSITSYTVANVGLEGMNDNATHQGEATRQTLTDSSISENTSDYSLPTDSTNDITLDGFGSIFDRIRATFTSGSASPITITIPFTNRSFTISKQSVYGSANLGIVGTLIQSFWWFVVSLFIVKDIFKKIEAIKSGNIEFAETTNIKEDIL